MSIRTSTCILDVFIIPSYLIHTVHKIEFIHSKLNLLKVLSLISGAGVSPCGPWAPSTSSNVFY